ncbi:general transcription factor 3C polypeptide 2 isoform X2 [Myripristis murdjan]|uniref:general transcription factor 3C polypeptide 2 isoform X2 n=1 Tax=Myripristis murdjan TaxID=586833 RepID=UPI001175CC7F|nr:general transcription factor 3C polypeptide 2 isoform X2 [Myripristis murdjan]
MEEGTSEDLSLTHEEASDERNTAQQSKQEPMDAPDSVQGQEQPSEQLSDLTCRSQGRQRKKNPKYFDYVTDEKVTQSPGQKRLRRTSVQKSLEEGETSGKSPAKRRKSMKAAEAKTDGDKEATDNNPQSVDETTQETPKKTVGTKKTPAKRTPAKKTPAKKNIPTKVDLSLAEGPGAETGIQEKETPKPKRKYVRRKTIQEGAPVETSAPQEHQEENPIEPADETTPGGRPRRVAAKAALKYLHSLAKEVFTHCSDDVGSQPGANGEGSSPDSGPRQKGPKGGKGSRRQKRTFMDFDSADSAEDEDFLPDGEEEDMEGEEAQDSDSDSDLEPAGKSPGASHFHRNIGQKKMNGKAPNGLTLNVMQTVKESIESSKKFLEEHCSSWVFPEWVPSINAWHLVPSCDLEKYLPQELQSVAFKVSREGLRNEETLLQRLNRFESVAPHPQRWDMFLYAGGPVWAMEWCPSPDDATAKQYVALACHRGMDDQHFANKKYTEPGLIQLWDLGKLEYDNSPESKPVLAYGLAQDKGFIWHLKWCPAGAWELPSCSRKAPFMPRLGLLAAATSTGVVTIYSLPHPDALLNNKKLPDSGEGSQQPLIYKAEGVITLKLGSFKAPHHERSGQIMSMDWLPEKPHNVMAIGFYDGIVGLWDLSTKSLLLRVREPDRSMTLLPYKCFLAHDNAVRAMAFCAASRHLLVTAGDDRMVKTWDLRRAYSPLTAQKRYLTTEVYWPLSSSGILLSQEAAFATCGLNGVHYFDLGYHNQRSIFLVPRSGTMWSISFTDWMNALLTSDTLGEVIFALLPMMNVAPQFNKRPIERRFPVFFTDMVPYDANTAKAGNQEMEGLEQEGDVVEKKKGKDPEGVDAGAEGDKESGNGKEGEGEGAGESGSLPPSPQTYREAVKKYYLHYTDSDMRHFKNSQRRAPWERMKATEVKSRVSMDVLPVGALHKVRFNPNMSCHTWLVSAGQAGLVRVHCLQGMNTSNIQMMVSKNQAQFNALYSPEDQL